MTHWLDELQPQPLLRDRRDYQRAARELANEGLRPRDIADALHLTVGAVVELLNEPLPLPPRGKLRK